MPIPRDERSRPANLPSKEERERDAAQAVREYHDRNRAIDAKTARLRALRLAKEAADAKPGKPGKRRKSES